MRSSSNSLQDVSIPYFVGRLLFIYLFALLLIGAIVYSSYLSPDGRRICNDFSAFYVAGGMSADGRAASAYHASEMFKSLEEFCGTGIMMPWTYPPTFYLIVAPLSFLPMALSYVLFTGIGMVTFLCILRRLSKSIRDYNIALIACLPAVTLNIITGQNGFITASLVGFFCYALLNRSVAGGYALGMLVIKPHLGIGVGLLALFERQWKTAIMALCVSFLLVAISAVAFGLDVWGSFLGALRESSQFLSEGRYQLFRMTSVYAAFYTIGVSAAAAMTLQICAALLSVVLIFFVFSRNWELRIKLGVTILLSFGVSPYFYAYDWCMFAISIVLFLPILEETAGRLEMVALLFLSWFVTGYGLFNVFFGPDDVNEMARLSGEKLSLGGFGFLIIVSVVFVILLRPLTARHRFSST